MKKIHVIGFLAIATGVAIIISTAGDASAYVTFTEAKKLSLSGIDQKIHVVGDLTRDEAGNVVSIFPSPEKTSFYFTLTDENGFEQRVYHNAPEPQDFRRSEKVVIIGSYQEEIFIADKILLKCPSKYEENTLSIES